MLTRRAQNALDYGYEFRFGDYISRGMDIVNRDMGSYVGFTALYLLISFVAQIIPFIGPIANAVISPALQIGPKIVAHQMERNERYEFGTFFKGFDRLGDLFVTALLTGLIVLATMIPGLIVMLTAGGFSLDGFEEPNFPILALSFLLMLIPAAYFGISYSWAPMFVWFYGMSAWEGMQASKKLISHNFWGIFGFLFVVGLLSALGMIVLCVGLLYTLPVGIIAQYVAFADITGLHENDEEETPGDELIDHFAPDSGL